MRNIFLGLVVILALHGSASAQEARAQEASAQEAIVLGEGIPVMEDMPAPQPSRFRVSAEYLMWWIKDDRAPGPLVTTGPANDPKAGVMGNPGTSALFDGSHLDYRLNSGTRLTLGWWLVPEEILGVEASGFVLETHTIHGKVDSNRTDGSPVIARPFFNVLTGKEDAQIITSSSGPNGSYLGGIDVFGDSRTWGGEINAVGLLGYFGKAKWDWLGGFRYLGQKDQLRFSQSSTVLTPGTVGFPEPGGTGAPAPAPDIVSWRDYYETHNNFYGGQVGARAEFRRGRWRLDVLGKIGLGSTVQDLHVSGHTLLTDSTGKTLSVPGGLYTQLSNIGAFSRTQFTMISEVGVGLGFQLTERWQARFGYSFLYWSDVARPGGQVNRNLDPRQIPSNLVFNPAAQANQPGRRFEGTDFWAQGLTFGLQFEF